MKEIIEKLQLRTDVSVYSPDFIRNMIQNRMQELKIEDFDLYKRVIDTHLSELDKLENQLKNSYSRFFRNRLTFQTLSNVILPVLLLKQGDKKEIRIWSAGCAAGQEAYSLAMVFESFNSANIQKLKYRIFATDREYNQLENAVLGEYRKADLLQVTVGDLAAFFSTKGNVYKVNNALKQHIQFELFDLNNNESLCPASSIFGEFDIVMCANVLIYYNKEIQNRILSNFRKCMSKDGYILTDEAEREILLAHGFSEVYPQSCIFKM